MIFTLTDGIKLMRGMFSKIIKKSILLVTGVSLKAMIMKHISELEIMGLIQPARTKQSPLYPKFSVGELVETKYPGASNQIIGIIIDVKHTKALEYKAVMYEVVATHGSFLVLESWLQRIEF